MIFQGRLRLTGENLTSVQSSPLFGGGAPFVAKARFS